MRQSHFFFEKLPIVVTSLNTRAVAFCKILSNLQSAVWLKKKNCMGQICLLSPEPAHKEASSHLASSTLTCFARGKAIFKLPRERQPTQSAPCAPQTWLYQELGAGTRSRKTPFISPRASWLPRSPQWLEGITLAAPMGGERLHFSLTQAWVGIPVPPPVNCVTWSGLSSP